MQNSRLDWSWAGNKIARKNINNLRYADDTTLMAESPILCPPDVKSWLIEKDPDVEKDWGQEEKGTAEDEMVRIDRQNPSQIQWTRIWANSGR